MIQLEEALARPEFESIDLDIAVADAHDHITDAVHGLTTSDSEEGTKYRTTNGMLVAIVGTSSANRDGERATIAYRTAPPSEPATRKAAKIADALKSYAVDR
ncbi:hypothetical protein [Natrinema gelatinilyticum]|uniref:hypothetical protein n=1 Tax=Natrinema gelatinilyticum TaxID=2961571 RepID=UPI0020C2BD97|nr:hypothetical protein [Natrinema gelatinilyticum]